MTAWGNVDLPWKPAPGAPVTSSKKPWDNNRPAGTIRKQAEPVRRRKSELEIAANVPAETLPRKTSAPASNRSTMRTLHAARECRRRLLRFPRNAGRTIASSSRRSGKGVPRRPPDGNLQACFRSQPPHALLRPAEVLATVNRHFSFDSTARPANPSHSHLSAIYDDAHAPDPLSELRPTRPPLL